MDGPRMEPGGVASSASVSTSLSLAPLWLIKIPIYSVQVFYLRYNYPEGWSGSYGSFVTVLLVRKTAENITVITRILYDHPSRWRVTTSLLAISALSDLWDWISPYYSTNRWVVKILVNNCYAEMRLGCVNGCWRRLAVVAKVTG